MCILKGTKSFNRYTLAATMKEYMSLHIFKELQHKQVKLQATIDRGKYKEKQSLKICIVLYNIITKRLLIYETLTIDQCLFFIRYKIISEHVPRNIFYFNIMDLFKDDWGPDISLKDLNLFKHSISLNLHILILYNRV